MSDNNMKVDLELSADVRHADKVRALKSDLDGVLKTLKEITKNNIPDNLAGKLQPKSAVDAVNAIKAQAQAAGKVSAMEAQATRQRRADARAEASERQALDVAGMSALRARFGFEARMRRQRAAEEQDAARAEKALASEAMIALRERFAFQSRMQRQQAQEARDLARQQADAARQAARVVREQGREQAAAAKAQANEARDLARQQAETARQAARAARDAAKEQAGAVRAQAAQVRELAQLQARSARTMASGVGQVRSGIGRAAVAGAAGTAVLGAGARKGLDSLTKSGVGIDEALTQASIHIYGTMPAAEARKAAEALRKRVMGIAVKLGSKTSDVIGAYVEASQAGVDSDILDKVTELGSKYAKMNKLNLPNVLEESGYALQGLKAFGTVTDKVVSDYFNHMSYLVATTAANREQMNSFGKRGLAAGASVGMSPDDTLAFGAAATAAGAEGNQAARMLSSQTGRIAGWAMHARDIRHQRHRSEEDKLFLRGPELLGFGGFEEMQEAFKTNFFETFAKVQERLKLIQDPLERRSLEKQLYGQEFGSITDGMVMGSNLRDYREKLKSPEANNFLEHNWTKQTGAFGFIVDQIASAFSNLTDSLGLALKPFWSDLRDFALRTPAAFDNFEESFKASLTGFMGGLGSPDGTMAGLLKAQFGDPEGFRLNVKAIGDAARGFGLGLRDVGETVRGAFRLFSGGDDSAESMGRWAARFMGFSAALIIAAPAITILGGIGTAVIGFASAIRAAMIGLKAIGGTAGTGILARIGFAGLGARILGGLGLSIAAELGEHRGRIVTVILDGLKAFLGGIGAALRDALSPSGIADALGSFGREFVPAPLQRWLDGRHQDPMAPGAAPPGTPGRADGGFIYGPGGSRSDSILARLSNGEFVVNAASASRHRGLLEAINGGSLPAFANGGPIGQAPGFSAHRDFWSRPTTGQNDDIRELTRALQDLAFALRRVRHPEGGFDLAEEVAANTRRIALAIGDGAHVQLASVTCSTVAAAIRATGIGISTSPAGSSQGPDAGAGYGPSGFPKAPGMKVPEWYGGRGSEAGAGAGTGSTVARGSLATNQSEAYKAALAEGLSPTAARALVANMSGESLRNPQDHHWDRKHMSQGIVQWDPQRAAAIQRQFGKLPKDMTVSEQTRAAIWEMKSNPRFARTWQALQGSDHRTMLDALVRNYESPANPEKAIAERQGYYNGFRPGEPGAAGAVTSRTGGQFDGLRVKGGQATAGGGTAEGVTDLARAAQADLPGGVKHFGAFNDRYHLGTGSKHALGLAFDTSLLDPSKSAEAAEAMRAKLRAAGLSAEAFRVIDEYRNPSARSTGGHLHTQFNSREAAERYHRFVQAQGGATVADGITSTGRRQAASPSEAAQQVPTPTRRPNVDDLAGQAAQPRPVRVVPGGGAGGDGGHGIGTTIHAPVTINGAQMSSGEIAGSLQRHVSEARGFRTHDYEPELS